MSRDMTVRRILSALALGRACCKTAIWSRVPLCFPSPPGKYSVRRPRRVYLGGTFVEHAHDLGQSRRLADSMQSLEGPLLVQQGHHSVFPRFWDPPDRVQETKVSRESRCWQGVEWVFMGEML